MRNLFTFLLAFVFTIGLYGQEASRLIQNPDNHPHLKETRSIDLSQRHKIIELSNQSTNTTSTVPLGTVSSDAVTSIKIGEASNAFTAITVEPNQISVVGDAGSNGGSVAFIYRQNVNNCGGSSGNYGYSISTDGGMSWNVGPGINTGGGTPAVGCYGVGTLNPQYVRNSRYPNMVLSLPPDSTGIENLEAVYAGPVLTTSTTNPMWDGNVRGLVDSVAFTPVVRQEDYANINGGGQYFTYSLVERVPGDFFYLSFGWDLSTETVLGDIYINRGTRNPATGLLDWSTQTITPDYYIGFDGTNTFTGSLSLGFSPDGMTGYIGGIADLNGKKDSVLNVMFSKSTDGGMTWGAFEEYDASNPELIDSLQFYQLIDSASGDTVFQFGSKPSTGFDIDLVVDKNGNPHLFTYVMHSTIWDEGAQAYTTPQYSIYTGSEKMMIDFTIDPFGDLGMLFLSHQSTYDGTFGDASVTDGTVDLPIFIQASRSADGSVIFFSWTDSDSSLTFDNDIPDLLTVAYDVDANMMTEVTNWTSDDGLWAGNVVTPHVAPVGITNGTVHTFPTVVMNFDVGDVLSACSFWHFSDVMYDQATDFTETPHFFYNCKENPFANTPNVTSPDCGMSDGSVTIAPGGGVAPFTYQWDANAGSVTTATAGSLSAGIYEVIVTDSKACKDTVTVTVNDANAPSLAISAQADISCNGADDGTATITPTGGAGGETYSWSNGEMTATAVSLPPGTTTVTVTDMVGCSAVTTVTVSEPTAIVASATSTDVLCNGEMTGEASATGMGGTGTLSYAWDNGGSGPVQSNLLAGTYTVTVTDVNGCDVMASTTISEPAALVSSLTPFPNNEMTDYDGSILANVQGGTGVLTYHWTGPAGFDTMAVNYNFPNKLCGGTYFLEVTDANGCVLRDTAFVGGDGTNCDGLMFIFPPASSGVNSMSVFPNPSSGSFFLSVELDQLDDMTIEVLNFRGQIIATRSAQRVLEVEESFDLSAEAAGIYMVKVTTSLGSATEKIMIR